MDPADLGLLCLQAEIVQRFDESGLELTFFKLVKESLEVVVILTPSPELAVLVNGDGTVSVASDRFELDGVVIHLELLEFFADFDLVSIIVNSLTKHAVVACSRSEDSLLSSLGVLKLGIANTMIVSLGAPYSTTQVIVWKLDFDCLI